MKIRIMVPTLGFLNLTTLNSPKCLNKHVSKTLSTIRARDKVKFYHAMIDHKNNHEIGKKGLQGEKLPSIRSLALF